jgi:beta-glucanase (GH16 family)
MMRPGLRGAASVVAAICVLGALGTGCSSRSNALTARPMATGHWVIDRRDTFGGSMLDPKLWTTCYWWERNGCTNLGNQEAQWYGPGQVRPRDGQLHLVAAPEPSTHLGRSFSYRSGMVSTGRIGNGPGDAARYAFTYGYVEARFRTPSGQGLWPAIWMLPVTNRSLPEIDLLEQYGDDTRLASMTLHAQLPGHPTQVHRHHARTADLSSGWHTIGLEWTRGRLRWFLDGAATYEVSGPEVPSEPMYLLMNLAVGGPAKSPTASTTFPATFLVDEVTVWRQT